ncbi:MAG TPA: isoleucine--tRNA ligase [Opitutaceae bacterium]
MAQDLKDTLNLPRTEFPMRANLVAREPQRLKFWEALHVYQRAQEKNSGGPTFILHDGPPFTSGHAHIGTALNKILKDIIVRYKLARGHWTPFIPGWDCHGLPIEARVTAQMRAEGRTMETPELREACAAFSAGFIETMRTQFQRLGVIGDWDKEYRTMNPAYEAEVLRTFAAFVERGLVYRSKKPVYWSIPCETALAEAEIEYKDHVSPSIWVKFAVRNPDRLGIEGPASVVIWTTTPWTLPANLAVAVHPDLDYVVMRSGDERFVVASALADRFAADCALESYSIEGTHRGIDLEAVATLHPFINRESPIVIADYVTTESGTGCVHTAPGHGLEDYQTGMKYGLEIYCPIDDQGRYVDDGRVPASLVGVTVLETDGVSPANEAILGLLRESGTLLKFKRYTHSYPHCWRSKTPVVFRALDQWFISVDHDDLRAKALQAIGKVEWIPAWGENRIRGVVESKPDWCISRQRQWGVPIPVFYDEQGSPFLDPVVVRAIADKVARSGVNIWFRESAESLLEGIAIPASWQGRKFSKGTDTLDVWIESGTSHLAVLKQRDPPMWPADLYLEGSDQHRGWFQSSLWTSLVTNERPPYRRILTHGFVVGQDGRKISKSDGKPQTVDTYVKAYGADVIRLWVASTDFRDDIPLSDEILSHVAETYRLFRNTLRFQISNLYDFDPAKDAVGDEALDLIDRWALGRTAEFVRAATAAYEAWEFHRVYQLCNQFCSITLSSQYHDILKDRLYTLAPSSHLRRSSQTVIHRVFFALARLLGPILAFTTDEAWAHFTTGTDLSDNMLLLQGWPDDLSSNRHAEAVSQVDRLLRLRNRVNEKIEGSRQSGLIGKSLEAAVTIRGPASDGDMQTALKNRDALAELFIVSQVSLELKDGSETAIEVVHAPGGRCPRCWRWIENLAGGVENTHLCPRCTEALRDQ